MSTDAPPSTATLGHGIAHDPRLDALLATEVVTAGVARAVSAGHARRTPAGWQLAVGAAGETGTACPTRPETPFDLASVTKPVTALAAARLAHAGQLRLDQPLQSLLPLTAGTPSADVPLELFMAHRAGLLAHLELFAPLQRRRGVDRASALRTAAEGRAPENPGAAPEAGFAPVYSDLGYILLGASLECVAGSPLDVVLREQVCAPLGLDIGSAAQWLGRDSDFVARVAPTENVAFRGGTLRGVVHDENAWALSGHGASGHAGLFGSIDSVLRLGAAVLDCLHGYSEFLPPSAAGQLVRPRPGGSLRAGFDGCASRGSSAGSLAGPQTFGHLGFTGTSLWCDPDRMAVTAVLTNRVHPTREHIAIRQARPRIHDALWSRIDDV